MINKIREKLNFMQKCYKERNNENVGELKKLLFGSDSKPIIIGTGGYEWCTDDKTVTELFTDDWEYWGDFEMNLDSLKCTYGDRFGSFSVASSVTYDLDFDEGYGDIFNLMNESATSEQDAKEKLGFLVWFSSIMLSDKDRSKNKYSTPVNMSGIFEICDGEPVVRSLHFAVIMDVNQPDLRNDKETSIKYYGKLRDALRKYIDENEASTSCNTAAKIKDAVSALFAGDKVLVENKNDNYFMSTDFTEKNILCLSDYINDLYKNGYKADINKDDIFVSECDGEFYFVGIGTLNSQIKLEQELNSILKNVDYYKSLGEDKDAIFAIRRDLAYLQKKYLISDKCTAPIRFEGRGIIENSNNVEFSFIKITYPNDWFFEDKNKYIISE